MANQDWKNFLAPHYGQKRRITWQRGTGAAHRAIELDVYVFDAAEEADAVEGLVDSIIGDWEVVEDAIGKGADDLVMFATESDGEDDDGEENDDPFAMVDVILFYDKATGEVYYYEEGDYEPASAGEGKPPYRLDQLEIEAP
jgi:hypothetical protein